MDIAQFTQEYLDDLTGTISHLPRDSVFAVLQILYDAYVDGRHVFIIGNGGSATLASHFACDLGKGTLERLYDFDEKRFRVIALTDNMALITALANDLTFDDIFVQQLRNYIREGDVLFVISGSGNSPNLIRAVNYASHAGAVTVGLLGFEGGRLGQLLHRSVIVPSHHYGIIEGLHGDLCHLFACGVAKMKKDAAGSGDQKISQEMERGGREEMAKYIA